MTGDFRALVELLEERIFDYHRAYAIRDHAWDNRPPGSGPDITPHDNAVLQAEDAVRNAAHNLTRLT